MAARCVGAVPGRELPRGERLGATGGAPLAAQRAGRELRTRGAPRGGEPRGEPMGSPGEPREAAGEPCGMMGSVD